MNFRTQYSDSTQLLETQILLQNDWHIILMERQEKSTIVQGKNNSSNITRLHSREYGKKDR